MTTNYNGSMDFQGRNVINQINQPIPPQDLPDPYDRINVKTLNIVDDNNNILYTLPQQHVPDPNGDVIVLNYNGTSSLQPYIQPIQAFLSAESPQNSPTLFYVQNGQTLPVPWTLSDTLLNENFIYDDASSAYKVLVDGTFRLTFNVSISWSASIGTIYSIFLTPTVNGNPVSTKTVYFTGNQGSNLYYMQFDQLFQAKANDIINVQINNPTYNGQRIAFVYWNMYINRVADYINRITATAIYGVGTRNEPFSYYEPLVLDGCDKKNLVVPYPVYDKAINNVGTVIVDTPLPANVPKDLGLNPYNTYGVKIDSYLTQQPYTITFSGSIILHATGSEINTIFATLQYAPDGLTFKDLPQAPTLIYTNYLDDVGFYKTNGIPFYLQADNFISESNVNRGTFRVALKINPTNTSGVFSPNTKIFVNYPDPIKYVDTQNLSIASFFQLYPTPSPSTSTFFYSTAGTTYLGNIKNYYLISDSSVSPSVSLPLVWQNEYFTTNRFNRNAVILSFGDEITSKFQPTKTKLLLSSSVGVNYALQYRGYIFYNNSIPISNLTVNLIANGTISQSLSVSSVAQPAPTLYLLDFTLNFNYTSVGNDIIEFELRSPLMLPNLQFTMRNQDNVVDPNPSLFNIVPI